MREQYLTATAAARRLADDKKVTGIGAPESRARRLAKRFLSDLDDDLSHMCDSN
jgi:hypothetical protein